MNIDQATQNVETSGEETPDIETLEESLIELAEKLGCEEVIETYHKITGETTEEDELFDAESYSLDTTLIRVRMKERNLALKDVQEQIGVAYRTLIRWLNRDDFPKHQNLLKLAEILELEPHKLVYRWRRYGDNRPNESNDALRYIQRRIETIVTEILDDKETSKEKKFDALVKYHNILLKATK
ncbi:MAG: helix-turn-helix transcriptional regulator [Candidatus Poribacteria bacterium]|nr:helix-turn-helix transcriptional regulator [Candidatus Poribacteria bacterium]